MGKDTFVRIKNIIKTNRTEDMVDLTVKDNENFILASGMYNCSIIHKYFVGFSDCSRSNIFWFR